MKLPTKTNPAHCASKDSTRYILNGVALLNDIAVATDGRVMFVANLTRDDEDSKRDALVPTKAILAERRGKDRHNHVLPLMTIRDRAKPTDRQTAEVMHDANEVTNYGDIEHVEKYPEFTKCMTDPASHNMKMCLDVKLLAKLAKSFGDTMLVLHLDPAKFGYGSGRGYGEPDGYHGSIYATVQGQQEAFAVVMPANPKSELQGNHALERAMKLKAKRFAEAVSNPTTEGGGE